MKIKCDWEHNGNDSMLYSSNYVGAFSRGETLETGKFIDKRSCLGSFNEELLFENGYISG